MFETPISVNRKEGNDQESIQLANTFRPRHQRVNRATVQFLSFSPDGSKFKTAQ